MPASSAVSKPTRTCGWAIRGSALSTRSSSAGLSLDAQPPAFTCAVSLREDSVASFIFVYNHKTMWRIELAILVFGLASVCAAARIGESDPRLKNAFRRPQREGWTYVHLEGSPAQIGYQHGW